MTGTQKPDGRIDYQMAARRFVGTPDEVSMQLDELILALVALRRRLGLIAHPTDSAPARTFPQGAEPASRCPVRRGLRWPWSRYRPRRVWEEERA